MSVKKPLPEEVPVEIVPLPRRDDGTVVGSDAAKALGARGGLAKARKRKMLHSLGLVELAAEDDFTPYWRSVEPWVQANIDALAAMYGYVGPAASTAVGSAGVALASSRYYSDLAAKAPARNVTLFILADKLSSSSDVHLEKAHNFAKREAELRKKFEAQSKNPFEALLEDAAQDDD